MRSIKIPGCTLEIGGSQEEYNTIYAIDVGDPARTVIACFEITDEELGEIKKTKRIYYERLTFGSPFQPMRISTNLADNIELTKSED